MLVLIEKKLNSTYYFRNVHVTKETNQFNEKYVPMLNEYSNYIAPSKESKFAPSNLTLNSILNYSKSIEVKKTKGKKRLLINLN